MPHSAMLLMTQMMYNKIRTEWNSLGDEQKLGLQKFTCGLVTTNLAYLPAQKKICQSVAFIGVYTLKDLWPTFINDVLAIDNIDLALNILDSIPCALEETVVSQAIRAHIGSVMKSFFEVILDYLARVATDVRFLPVISESLRGWRPLRLSVFAHAGLTQQLLGYL